MVVTSGRQSRTVRKCNGSQQLRQAVGSCQARRERDAIWHVECWGSMWRATSCERVRRNAMGENPLC